MNNCEQAVSIACKDGLVNKTAKWNVYILDAFGKCGGTKKLEQKTATSRFEAIQIAERSLRGYMTPGDRLARQDLSDELVTAVRVIVRDATGDDSDIYADCVKEGK